MIGQIGIGVRADQLVVGKNLEPFIGEDKRRGIPGFNPGCRCDKPLEIGLIGGIATPVATVMHQAFPVMLLHLGLAAAVDELQPHDLRFGRRQDSVGVVGRVGKVKSSHVNANAEDRVRPFPNAVERQDPAIDGIGVGQRHPVERRGEGLRGAPKQRHCHQNYASHGRSTIDHQVKTRVDTQRGVPHRFTIMQPDFSLANRIALVTGSSRGLGLAIAQGLAAAGARVILHGKDPDRLAATAATFPNLAGTLAFDVSDTAATKAAFATIARDHGRLDILVNNAGAIPRKPLLETTDEEWASVIDSNLSACFRMSREAARLMVPAKSGRIIMVSSIMGIVGRPTIPGYVTAKAGLHGMVRGLSAELAPLGITVNAIAPGFMPTDATDTLHKDPKFNEWIASRAPMGRWGEPSELAGPAVFLASDAASYVTGHVLVVDGGLTASL